MGAFVDHTGRRYGALLVLRREPGNLKGHARWVTRCDCGAEQVMLAVNFVRRVRRCRSCASTAAATTHGMKGTKTYRAWQNMLTRCRNTRLSYAPRYSGRGITVDPRWLTFEAFFADMGESPPGLSLDRIDNDGNYEPGNCRWATPAQQVQNRGSRV